MKNKIKKNRRVCIMVKNKHYKNKKINNKNRFRNKKKIKNSKKKSRNKKYLENYILNF